MSEGKFQWFSDGKLNASGMYLKYFKSFTKVIKLLTVNCIDRHARVNPDKVALIWEKDEPGQEVKVSYKELSAMTNKLANLLKSQGIKKGDIVAIYMPMSPMAVAAMLACTRIGNVEKNLKIRFDENFSQFYRCYSLRHFCRIFFQSDCVKITRYESSGCHNSQ